MDTKIDEKTIEIQVIIPEEIKAKRYDIDSLLKRKQEIKDRKLKFNQILDQDLATIDDLILRCQNIGISTVVIPASSDTITPII